MTKKTKQNAVVQEKEMPAKKEKQKQQKSMKPYKF